MGLFRQTGRSWRGPQPIIAGRMGTFGPSLAGTRVEQVNLFC